MELACENIRFSSLFVAGQAKRPQRQRARRNGCFRRLMELVTPPSHESGYFSLKPRISLPVFEWTGL